VNRLLYHLLLLRKAALAKVRLTKDPLLGDRINFNRLQAADLNKGMEVQVQHDEYDRI
jgi:hypothetical protein